MSSACLSICVPCASVLRAYMWRAKGSGMGFIIEYYLIHSYQHCICESQNNKTQVPCCLLPFGWGSRGTGFIMEYAFVCGGSACELCLCCAAPIVIQTSVMNKTCDPVSIRVQGCDPFSIRVAVISHLAIAKLAQVGSNLFARFRDLCADVRPACAGCPEPSAESFCARDFCA